MLDLVFKKVYYDFAIGGFFFMELAVFEQLEKRIEKLIGQHAELKKENKKLAEALNSKDKELEALRSKLEKFGKEKGLIMEKVETILQRVEGVEGLIQPA